LFKVGPELNWENAGVCLLAKEVLGPLHSMSILEAGKGPELRLPEKSGGKGSFGLACCLDEATRAGEGGLTRGGDTGISDGDQREFDLETRVITNENIIIPELFHSCALNK